MFTLKKWNAVAMWSWDVECDTCAICRVQVMDACLRCQSETKVDCRGGKDCVVVWGECNHSFHQCCMSLWIKQKSMPTLPARVDCTEAGKVICSVICAPYCPIEVKLF